MITGLRNHGFCHRLQPPVRKLSRAVPFANQHTTSRTQHTARCRDMDHLISRDALPSSGVGAARRNDVSLGARKLRKPHCSCLSIRENDVSTRLGNHGPEIRLRAEFSSEPNQKSLKMQRKSCVTRRLLRQKATDPEVSTQVREAFSPPRNAGPRNPSLCSKPCPEPAEGSHSGASA